MKPSSVGKLVFLRADASVNILTVGHNLINYTAKVIWISLNLQKCLYAGGKLSYV